LLHASAADTNRALSSVDAKRIGTAVNTGTSSSRFYNANGSAAGRSQASGNTTRFYQANGASSGRTQQSGGTVYFYDASGRSEGRAQKNGSTTTFYDSNGRPAGRATTSGSVATFVTPAAGLPAALHPPVIQRRSTTLTAVQRGAYPVNRRMKIQSGRKPAATRGVASRKRQHGKPRKPAVLIVDDDCDLREMISVILRRFACVRTYRAATNAEGLRKARRYQISAVISDIGRQKGDGFRFLEEFRREFPRIPVIISSGRAVEDYWPRCERLGAFAFLPKAYKREELVEVVAEALRSARKESRA